MCGVRGEADFFMRCMCPVLVSGLAQILMASPVLVAHEHSPEARGQTSSEKKNLDATINDSGKTGWLLVRYQGVNLGWIKALPNRINNYYPKELRISNL